MTKADLLAMLADLPDNTEIVIHAPPRRAEYQSILTLTRTRYVPGEVVDGFEFLPSVILKGS